LILMSEYVLINTFLCYTRTVSLVFMLEFAYCF
jgi:hypothetical protein